MHSQQNIKFYDGCSLCTVHDIMNIKWEVITTLCVAQLFHCVSKFQHNPPSYRYISTWHQSENSMMVEYGLLGFAAFTVSHMQFSLSWNWRPSNCCFSNPNNLLWGVIFSVTMQPHTAHGHRVVSLGSSGTSTLLFMLILQ